MLRASSFAARPLRWNRARQSPNGQLGGACTYPKRPKHRSPCLKLLSCAGWAVPRFNYRGEQTMTCYSALTAPFLNVVLLQVGVHHSCQRYRRCLHRILAWDGCGSTATAVSFPAGSAANERTATLPTKVVVQET